MKMKKDSKEVKLYNLKNLRQKEEEKMNKCKIVGLLLVAFIGLMGFNEHAFAAKKGSSRPRGTRNCLHLSDFNWYWTMLPCLTRRRGLCGKNP